MFDELLTASWRIHGVESILRGLQTSDAFHDTPEENAFFVLANELQQARHTIQNILDNTN